MNKIYVGMGGWDLLPFNKFFYPPKPKKGFRKLEFYSQFFDTVEINATFYNTSFTPDHVKRWADDVSRNKEFIFTVKLFKGFTHTYSANRNDLLSIHRMLEAFESKLGGLAVQFPYSFDNTPESRKYLMQLSRVLQPHNLFLEVRHNTWNTPLMYNFFQENKLRLVNVDLPQIKNHMPFNNLAWNHTAYFRMMGRNRISWNNPWRLEADKKHVVSDRYNYLYNEKEVDDLFQTIEQTSVVSNRTFVVFHNDPEANSLVNGFQLRHLIKNKQRVLVPKNLITAFPQLKPISSAVNLVHPLFTEAEVNQ